MKQIITILILCTVSLNSYTQSNARADELKDVIFDFFEIYFVQSPAINNVRFIKKPDGYYVTKLEQYFDVISIEKFKDKDSIGYHDLTIFPKSDPAINTKRYNLAEGEMKEVESTGFEDFISFSFIFDEAKKYPFYGYNGYYNDIIDHYETLEDPSAIANYAYCRAWSNKLQNMVLDNYQNGVQSEKFKFANFHSKMSKKQLKQYKLIYEKQIETYRDFKNKYPDYKTKVGSSKLKYSHMVMDGYLNLFYSMNEKEAKKIIEKNLYEEDILDKSRLILKACPQNAILYTWGDNDTYPLYYLQAMEKLRTDVILINITLATIPKYILTVYNGPFKATPLKTSMERNFYKNYKLVSCRTYEGDSIISFENFMSSISNLSNYKFNGTNDYLILRCDKTSIELKKGKFGDGSSKITVPLGGNVYTDVISQFDILFNNYAERSICFTEDTILKGDLIWEEYLKKKGTIYILNE